MGFMSLLSNYAQTKIEQAKTPQVVIHRTADVPLDMSQGAAVTISSIALTLATTKGGLIKDDIAPSQGISLVGKFNLAGHTVFRSYLTGNEGAYIESSTINDKTTFQLYTPYDEIVPSTKDDWDFWLSDVDGYIGAPVFQSKDEDGPKQYQRVWQPGPTRVSPQKLFEQVMDSTGTRSVIEHRAMQYARKLGDQPNAPIEYMVVSAVTSHGESSVNLWLGVDLQPSDIQVFQSHQV